MRAVHLPSGGFTATIVNQRRETRKRQYEWKELRNNHELATSEELVSARFRNYASHLAATLAASPTPAQFQGRIVTR